MVKNYAVFAMERKDRIVGVPGGRVQCKSAGVSAGVCKEATQDVLVLRTLPDEGQTQKVVVVISKATHRAGRI